MEKICAKNNTNKVNLICHIKISTNLPYHKNCHIGNFPLGLRNSERVSNIKEETLRGKRIPYFAIVYFFEHLEILKANDHQKILFSQYQYIYIYIYM